MGSWGAGCTTADSPMLMALAWRIEPGTLGGGAMTVAWAVPAPPERREETPAISGEGATAVACSNPGWRALAWLESAGGATIQVGPLGTVRCERPVAESGIMGGGAVAIPSPLAPILPEPAAMRSGGRSVDCFWLPVCALSGATRIAGRRGGSDCRLVCARTRGE